jgi:hypothetical protein
VINQQRLWLSLGVAGLCSVLLLISVPVAPPRTEREAVMAILDQRSIAYEDVQIHHGAENGMPQDHFASVAAVVVETEPAAYGKIECLSSTSDCVLWIETMGIYQVPLPRLAVAPFWMHWIKRHGVATLLRAWLMRQASLSLLY